MMNNNKTALNKQRNAILLIAVVAVVLAAVYGILLLTGKNETLRVPLCDEVGDTLDYRFSCEKGSILSKTADEDGITVTAEGKITYTAMPYIYPEIPLDTLLSVCVEKGNDRYTLYRDAGTGSYLFEGYELLPYNAESVSNLKVAACVMLAERRLDATYDSDAVLSDFGLDDASEPLRVTVNDLDAHAHTVLVGDKLVSGSGYYAKDAARPYVYVLPDDVSVFFSDVLDCIVPRILPSLSQNDCQYIEKFTIDRHNAPFLDSRIVPEEKRTGTGDTDLHKLTYPAAYSVSPDKYYDVLLSFQNLVGTAVLETNVLGGDETRAEELFAKYGFGDPSNDISFTAGGKEYRFLTGASFEDENAGTVYYVYSPYTDAVIALPLTSAPYLAYGLLDYINPNVFQLRIDDIAHMTIKTETDSVTYDFEGSGKELIVTERATGEEVDVASFRQLYIAMLSVRIEDYAAPETVREDAEPELDPDVAEAAAAVSEKTGTETVVSHVAPEDVVEEQEETYELSFSVTTRYGETVTFAFPRLSTTRSLIMIGSDGEFYTNRSRVTAILEKLAAFRSGEKLEADW